MKVKGFFRVLMITTLSEHSDNIKACVAIAEGKENGSSMKKKLLMISYGIKLFAFWFLWLKHTKSLIDSEKLFEIET